MANTAAVCMADEVGKNMVCALLKKHGMQVLRYSDTASLLRGIRSRNIDIVVMDEDGNQIQCIDLLHSIKNSQDAVEVILFSERHSELAHYIKKELIFGCFSLPLNRYEMEQLLLGALVNNRRMRKMQREMDELKYRLNRRVLVEKAKEILAEQKNISLEKAHDILIQLSMRRGISLEEIARSILQSREKTKE